MTLGVQCINRGLTYLFFQNDINIYYLLYLLYSKMIFVSIGIDCDVANFLNKYNLRKMSLPFDWNVSYNGVSKCIDCNFEKFTEPLNKERINEQDIYFHHDFENIENSDAIIADREKYLRRCNRLSNIFKECEKTGEYIIFIRKGHMCYHHDEQNGKYTNITDDCDDAKSLDSILLSKYPILKYKIIVILGCTKCFNKNTIDDKSKSNSKNIEVYNNVCNQDEDRNALFEKCLLNICIEKIKELQ